ncbi:unnamed protein product [Rhizoctonia solani]|uniref:Uncharacterized protein n=1 Tax=Rhizoctonia solani TaxID=456999 RepID=A0A8H3C946_9AGAM|nr:unnamed protein product [Rhizoctonia solani]
MPATDDSSEHTTSSSSPVFSFTQSVDSVTSSDESMDHKLGIDTTCTPTRARRYPAHLSHGSPRKPHLNPNQYETMEELLAAAGYTVTRVFTPETERTQKMQDAKDEQKEGGGGIGTIFAGWIAQILPAATTSGTSKSNTRPEPAVQDDIGSNPFLTVHSTSGQFPQATRSLRTHLMTLALGSHPRPPPAQDTQQTITTARSPPRLRHVTSAPSLPRTASGRRRALPSAWREPAVHKADARPPKTGWSGGFVPKQSEVQLASRSGKSWFTTVTSDSTVRARSGSQPPRASRTLSPPMVHRARSAPRLNKVHVPAPAPPVRPSPVVQQNVVVCRSVSSFGSSSSVHTWSSVKSKSKSKLSLQSDDEEPVSPCPVLTPESAHPDGLPSTPARPVLVKQRSARFLRRPTPQPQPIEDDEPEPDLASIIDAFRPPSAPPSPTRRQRSIRSLRAVLKDPRFPDVPVVCVASPGTVSAGGAGRALWIRDSGWDATVRK